MARNNNIYNNEDRYKIEEANRIEALENIVRNHTRTKEFIENHSDKIFSKEMNELTWLLFVFNIKIKQANS